MIIVEGADGSGKSTLCRMLLAEGLVEKVLPSPRITAKGDTERMKYETDQYLRIYGTNNRVAVDRFLFSEIVYGPILRGSSVLSRNEYLTKLLELMMSGSIIIFCLPEKLHFKPDENPAVLEKIELIKQAYQACFEDVAFTTSRTYLYNWESLHSFKKLKKFIKENQK